MKLSKLIFFIQIIFYILFFANQFQCYKNTDPHPYEHKCNQDLVRSFGMIGREYPTATRMGMCPSINSSCCLQKDQLMIFNNWISMKEKDFVTRRFDINQEIYTKFLNLLSQVEDIAKKMIIRLEQRKISNCKVLGKRILHFEVSALIPQIRKNIKKMRDFLETSYRGVYCGMCAHETHGYVDTKRKIISFCDSFCRELLENGLPYLLFFHVDVVKFVNLISKFMTSCDYKGDYDTESLIPKKRIFFIDKEDHLQLDDCRKNRNKREWMAYCSPICEKFNIAMLSPYFEPNIDQIKSYNVWLKKMIDFKKIEHKHHPLFEEKDQDHKGNAQLFPQKSVNLFNTGKKKSNDSGFRILESSPKINRKRKLKKKRILEEKVSSSKDSDPRKSDPDKIFISKINSKFPLETYISRFSGDGLCLFDFGASSLINVSIYNEIKMVHHLSNMTKAPNGVIRVVKNMIGLDGLSKEERREINKLNSGGTFFNFVDRLFAQLLLGMIMLCLIIIKD